MPGDPHAIGEQVRHLRDVADELRDQVRRLSQLGEDGALKGQYADRLREAAGDLVDDLQRVQNRYSRVASALSPWSGQLSSAQSDADRIRIRAQLLDAERERLEAVAGAYRPTTLPADATPAQQASADAGAAAHARVMARLAEIRRELERLDEQLGDVERQRDRDARTVAHEVRDTLDDKVKDSRWDDVKGAVSGAVHRAADAVSNTVTGAIDWVGAKIDQYASVIKKSLEFLSWIATGLAIAALFIPGINVLVIAGLALALVIGHGVLLATGNGSWAEFGMAVLGLLTFGAGALASRSRSPRAPVPCGRPPRSPAARCDSATRATLGPRFAWAAAWAPPHPAQQRRNTPSWRRSRTRPGRKPPGAAQRPRRTTWQSRVYDLRAARSCSVGGERDVAAVARDLARVRRQFPDPGVARAGRYGVPAIRVMQGAFLTGSTRDLGDKALGKSDLFPHKPYLPAYQGWKDSTAP